MNNLNIKKDAADYHVDEAYKVLRTNLQFCGEDKKVIAVTSSIPGEGKSSISLRVAISMAEAGKKVLFVDADLRRSVLARKIKGGANAKGLTHFLSQQEKLPDIINGSNIANLYVILAGPVPPNPTELLNEKPFVELLEVAKRIYDYIIIDTPPLGSVIDSAIIAEKCDGAIVIIESGVVSARFVEHNLSQLRKSNCPILGAVLNKMDREQNGKYGKYYGKYGKHYGRYTGKYKGAYTSDKAK